MTIGVAISTHKRPATLARALQNWARVMPDILVVTHDIDGQGVAATKNRGIAALMDAGCDHLFLADDDLWPATTPSHSPDWATPYITDDEPHLMHCWGKSRLVEDDGHHTIWGWPRGALLYVRRHVVDHIGGMRTQYGRWGGEHAEWSRRIYNAGFTMHPYTDLTVAKRGIWHAEDYLRRTPSSVSQEDKDEYQLRKVSLNALYDGTADYVEYRW